jgi:peptidoglycan hydrolase-like protein with peptidoglycan-binding domain
MIQTFRRTVTALFAVLAISLSSLLLAPAASAAGISCNDGAYRVSGSNAGWMPVHYYHDGTTNSTRKCYMNSSQGLAVAVRHLQRAYNECYARFGSKLVVDGDYGDLTKEAVRVIQSREGLVPTDGLYGPATAMKLRIPDEDSGLCFL